MLQDFCLSAGAAGPLGSLPEMNGSFMQRWEGEERQRFPDIKIKIKGGVVLTFYVFIYLPNINVFLLPISGR